MIKFTAVAIQMKSNCTNSNNLLEIDKIYLNDSEDGWYSKETIHNYLKENPKTIAVGNSYGPVVIPCISINGEKYVKSTPNNSNTDNLLNLPRK